MPDFLLYLYGFLLPGQEPPPADLTGVDGREVELLRLGPFDAVISRVPAEDFDAGRLEARLRDLEWVARQGEGHERVVTWFVDRAWILPARLFTLYRSEDSLEAFKEERGTELEEELARLHGHFEWDLKVSYDQARLSEHLGELSPAVKALDQEVEAAPPGKRYLLERSRRRKLDDEMEKTAQELAEGLLDELAGMADRSVRVPLPRSGDGSPVVLNAALLVAEAESGAFRKRLAQRSEDLEKRGLQVEFSGPWAPYRFLKRENDHGQAG